MTQYSCEPAQNVNSFKYPNILGNPFKSSNSWLFESAEAGNKVLIKTTRRLIFTIHLKLDGNVKQEPKRWMWLSMIFFPGLETIWHSFNFQGAALYCASSNLV